MRFNKIASVAPNQPKQFLKEFITVQMLEYLDGLFETGRL